MKRLQILAAFFIIIFGAARAAFAGGGEQSYSIGTTTAGRVYYNWPDKITGGYFPVFIEIHNGGKSEQRYNIEITRSTTRDRVERSSVIVKPGEKQTIEIPCFACFTPGMWGRISGGEGIVNFISFETTIYSTEGTARIPDFTNRELIDSDARAVLLATPKLPAAGDEERWQSSVGWAESRRGGTRYGAKGNVSISAISMNQLARRVESYSSLSMLVLDVSDGIPKEEFLNPILAWTRLGGVLVVIGNGGGEKIGRVPGVQSWIEPRFLKSEDPDGPQTYCYGLGTLTIDEAATGFDEVSFRERVRGQLRFNRPWVPRCGTSWADHLGLNMPGLGDFPYVSFLIILVIFVLIIGPVNFFIIKRKSRPTRLLITIPAISLFTTVGFVGYSIFSQGLDIRGVAYSITLLDQRNHQAETAMERTIFAGMLPSAGLRPSIGTLLFPVGEVDTKKNQLLSNLRQETEPFLWNQDEGLFSGRFLPARRLTRQMILTDHTARGRINITRKGPNLMIENGLDSAVRRMVVYDSQGRAYQCGPIRSGARAEAPMTTNPDNSFPRVFTSTKDLACTYEAQIASSPYVDHCGVTVNEVDSQHYMIGILPAREEDWK